MKKLVCFLEENLNKNTKIKTKSDMKVITDFFTSFGEERWHRDRYPPKDLDSIMARFFLGVLKRMVLNMNQILWVPCTTALADT